MRVVHRVHRNAANVRPNALPSRTARLTVGNVFVFGVADLADRRHAYNRYSSDFARRHSQLRVIAFLGNQLSKGTRASRHLSTLSRAKLDVMNLCSERYVPN